MISVIIPVYKVEKYLDKCVESVVGQTYSDLEIILVDDGSPDGCSAMCDAWAEKDGRIKVIHKPNGGLSSARNAGLVKASGEYVFFLDSDDTISANCIELLADAVRHDNSDICIANVARIDENGKPIINDGILDPNKPIGKILKGKNYFEPRLKEILENGN